MTIIIASGGTLGHLMPIIPVLEKLKIINKKVKIILFTTQKQVIPQILKTLPFDDIYYFKAKGITKNLISSYLTNRLVLKELKKRLLMIKPNLIIGMGGYISGLTAYVSKKLKYNVLIHEQNSVMGKANKLIISKIDYLIYSYPELKIKKRYLTKAAYLINPRQEAAYLEHLINPKIPNSLLIVSGSQGAKKINDFAIELAKYNYQITLITGEKYYLEYQKYQSTSLKIIPSTTNLLKLLATHELLISRAGATTIAEAIGANTLGIYIPSPNVVNNHQVKNVEFIIKKQIGEVIEEKDLSLPKVIEKLTYLKKHQEQILMNIANQNTQKAIDKYCSIIEKVGNK